MKYMNTYDDHPMGNMGPKGEGDNNRAMKGRQMVDKVWQQYHGSQLNPRWSDDAQHETRLPFNLDYMR